MSDVEKPTDALVEGCECGSALAWVLLYDRIKSGEVKLPASDWDLYKLTPL